MSDPMKSAAHYTRMRLLWGPIEEVAWTFFDALVLQTKLNCLQEKEISCRTWMTSH
jgi:hypothetical protein